MKDKNDHDKQTEKSVKGNKMRGFFKMLWSMIFVAFLFAIVLFLITIFMPDEVIRAFELLRGIFT